MEAVDALRELLRLGASSDSSETELQILSCATAVKLVLSPVGFTLGAKQEAFENGLECIKKTHRNEAWACEILNLFGNGVRESVLDDTVLVSLVSLCVEGCLDSAKRTPNYMLKRVEESNDEEIQKKSPSAGATTSVTEGGRRMSSLEQAYWNTLTLVFKFAKRHRELIATDVLIAAAKRFTSTSRIQFNRILAESNGIRLADVAPDDQYWLVERIDGKGTEVKIDSASAVILSLIQTTGSASLAWSRGLAEKVVEKCISAAGGSDDKDIVKSWFFLTRRLVYDALLLLRAPEFPSAEPFVLAISRALYREGGSTCFQTLAVELIGKILSEFERDDAKREAFWTPPPEVLVKDALALPDTAGEVIACACGEEFQGRFMLACDRCERWFHGACVGVSEMEKNLEQLRFLCDDCLAFSRVQEEIEFVRREKHDLIAMVVAPPAPVVAAQKKRGKKAAAAAAAAEAPQPVAVETDAEIAKRVRRALIRDHLKSEFSRRKDFLFGTALETYAASSADALEDAAQDEHRARDICLSRAGASRMARLIADSHSTADGDDPRQQLLVNLVRVMRRAKQPMLRAAAVKSLWGALEANPKLMDDVGVKQAVRERVADESVSVRESVLDLVGKFSVAAKDEARNEYRSIVLDRFDDAGTVVRKRAVRIVTVGLVEQDERGAAEILTKLGARLEDPREERTIKDLIVSQMSKYMCGANGADAKKIARALCLIPKTAYANGESGWLTTFVKNVLSNGGEPTDTTTTAGVKQAKQIRVVFEKIVDALVENVLMPPPIIVSKDLVGDACASPTSSFVVVSADARSPSPTKLAISIADSGLRALRAFSSADSQFLAPHLRLLLLKLPNGQLSSPEACATAAEVAEILASSDLQSLNDEEQRELECKLERLFYSQLPSSLPSIAKALERLNESCGLERAMRGILVTFFDYLEKKLLEIRCTPDGGGGEFDVKVKNNLQRSLFGVGTLIRHHAFGEADEIRALRVISQYSDEGTDLTVKKRALQSLGLVLSRRPDPAYSKFVYRGLESESSLEMKLQSLATFTEMLNATDVAPNRFKNDAREDDAVISTLTTTVQAKLPLCLEMLKHTDSRIRLASARVAEHLLRLGAAHPQQCVAKLISLERDPVSKLAVHACLRECHEKMKLSWASVCQGVIESSSFVNGGEMIEDFNCFSDAYVDFVSHERRDRLSFLKKLCDAACKRRVDSSQTMFLCGVLAALPYTSYEEVLTLISHVRKEVTLRANEIRSELDKLLGPILKKSVNGSSPVVLTEAEPKTVEDCRFCVTLALGFRLVKHLAGLYQIKLNRIDQFELNRTTVGGGKNEEKALPASFQNSLESPPRFAPGFVLPSFASLGLGSLAQGPFVELIRAMKDDAAAFSYSGKTHVEDEVEATSFTTPVVSQKRKTMGGSKGQRQLPKKIKDRSRRRSRDDSPEDEEHDDSEAEEEEDDEQDDENSSDEAQSDDQESAKKKYKPEVPVLIENSASVRRSAREKRPRMVLGGEEED